MPWGCPGVSRAKHSHCEPVPLALRACTDDGTKPSVVAKPWVRRVNAEETPGQTKQWEQGARDARHMSKLKQGKRRQQ